MPTFTVRRIAIPVLFSSVTVSSKRSTRVIVLAKRRTVNRGSLWYFSFISAYVPVRFKRFIKLVRKPTQEPGTVYSRDNVKAPYIVNRFKPTRKLVAGRPKAKFRGRVTQKFKFKGVVVTVAARNKAIKTIALYRRPAMKPDVGRIVWRPGLGIDQSLCYPSVSVTVESPTDATWNCDNLDLSIGLLSCGGTTVGVLHDGTAQHNGEVTHGDY